MRAEAGEVGQPPYLTPAERSPLIRKIRDENFPSNSHTIPRLGCRDRLHNRCQLQKKRKEEEGGGLGGSHQEEEEENDPLFLGLCRASSRDSAAAAVRLRQLWSETRRDECVHISFIFRPIQNISYDKMAYLPSAMN
jgi:hypothetical protein